MTDILQETHDSWKEKGFPYYSTDKAWRDNIFNQLKGIPCLVIDAGYIFETWQNPSLCDERDYCKTHNNE